MKYEIFFSLKKSKNTNKQKTTLSDGDFSLLFFLFFFVSLF